MLHHLRVDSQDKVCELAKQLGSFSHGKRLEPERFCYHTLFTSIVGNSKVHSSYHFHTSKTGQLNSITSVPSNTILVTGQVGDETV